MTGSGQVAKPAPCRPLPAGRGQTIAKNPANIYHSQIVQMGGSRIMRRRDSLHTTIGVAGSFREHRRGCTASASGTTKLEQV